MKFGRGTFVSSAGSCGLNDLVKLIVFGKWRWTTLKDTWRMQYSITDHESMLSPAILKTTRKPEKRGASFENDLL